MKKTMIITLALVFVLGIAGTAFAANPFVDVPAKHWSYDAVAKLAKAGIVDGYGDGTFRGEQNMTRYEMAQIVAKAMAKSDKADAETKALVDKLAVEFNAELQNLGVRVAKLEKNADNFKFTGNIRARFVSEDWSYDGDTLLKNTTKEMRTRIEPTAVINDEWTFGARFEQTEDFKNGGNSDNLRLDRAYVSGPVLNANVTLGRQDVFVGYGAFIDSAIDGVKVSFGKKLKTDIYYGTEDTGDDVTYTGASFTYPATDKTNFVAALHNLNRNEDSNINAWEIGFDTKLNDDVTLKASYLKGNADDVDEDGQDSGYFVGLNYKGADKDKVGSYGYWANYRSFETYSTWVSTFDVAYQWKGYEVGVNYTPAKNIIASAWYINATDTVDSDLKDKYIRAQVEMFF